jgi:MerR family mercuric resistance operon transcriptional regulator
MTSKKKKPAHFVPPNPLTARRVPIGVVARQSGCGIETIRFYEKAGVLPRAQRTESGRRIYDEGDVARITFIRRARELGFSLDDVRGLLRLAEGKEDACEKVQSVAQHHLDEIAVKIADLMTMQTVLGALVVRCEEDDNTTCPLIAALSENRKFNAPVKVHAPRC